jgi:hypothetical protein
VGGAAQGQQKTAAPDPSVVVPAAILPRTPVLSAVTGSEPVVVAGVEGQQWLRDTKTSCPTPSTAELIGGDPEVYEEFDAL